MNRQTTTKESLRTALAILLTEEDFTSISISKLCKKAGINRTTFYLHYNDKYDFLHQLKEDSLQVFNTILKNYQSNPREALFSALDFLHQEVFFFKAILQSNISEFSITFQNFIFGIIQYNTDALHFLTQYYQMPQNYAVSMFIASIEAVISKWIQTDCPESPEQLTTLLLHTPSFGWYEK